MRVDERCPPIVPRSSDKHCPHWLLALNACCWCSEVADSNGDHCPEARYREARR